MKDTSREIAELIERSGRYGTNGNAAYKLQPQEQPQYVRKTRRNVGRKQAQKQGVRNVLQALPAVVKAEILVTVAVVAVVMIALMAVQVAVGIVTADNNAMLRDIEAMENESHRLTEQIDSNIDMDQVYAAIADEGLVASNSFSSRP